jgi:hypothetical protein
MTTSINNELAAAPCQMLASSWECSMRRVPTFLAYLLLAALVAVAGMLILQHVGQPPCDDRSAMPWLKCEAGG